MNFKAFKILSCFFWGFFLSAQSLSPSSPSLSEKTPPRFALRVGKILTVTQGVIYDGMVLIQDGKYLKIGKDLEIPPDFPLFHYPEYWMFPGFVDLHSHIGASADLWDTAIPLNHDLGILSSIIADSKAFDQALRGGVTTLLLIPGSGANFSGFGALLKPLKTTLQEIVLKYPAALKVAQAWNPERQGGDLGRTRMGMSWGMRSVLERAKHYHQAWESYDKGETPQAPPLQPELEMLRGVFQGKYPIFVHTAGARDVVSTMRLFSDDYHLWVVLSHGCFDAFKVAPEFAKRNIHLNLGPRIFAYYYGRERRIFNIAELYQQASVSLSLCTDAPVIPEADFSLQASFSIRLGLDPQKALEALTINPARAIGIGDQVGSIEVGKSADFLLKAGDPFDLRLPLQAVYINGIKRYDRDNEQQQNPPLVVDSTPFHFDCCHEEEECWYLENPQRKEEVAYEE